MPVVRTLEDQLDALCKKHNLESISIVRQTSAVGEGEYFTAVSLRGKDGEFEVTTTGTVGEQISYCTASLATQRAAKKSVEELVAAE